MAIRTTAELVGGIIEVNASIPLTPFIAAASSLVDIIESQQDSNNSISAAQLILVETWLAAHFYCMRDPRVVSEKAGSVSATYQSKVGLKLYLSHYGQMAMSLDTTGILQSLSNGKRVATATWLGTCDDN